MGAETAVGLVMVVVLWVLKAHEKRLGVHDDQLRSRAEEAANLMAVQQQCRKDIERRLSHGDRNFSKFDRQLQVFQKNLAAFDRTVARIETVNRMFAEQIAIMDNRIYQQGPPKKE